MNGCKGCIRTAQWPMKKRNKKGKKGFYVLYDLVTSAGDLWSYLWMPIGVYIIFLSHCVDVEGQGM